MEEDERARLFSQELRELQNAATDIRDSMTYFLEQSVNFNEHALRSQRERMLTRHGRFLEYARAMLALSRRRTNNPMYRNVDDVVGYV